MPIYSYKKGIKNGTLIFSLASILYSLFYGLFKKLKNPQVYASLSSYLRILWTCKKMKTIFRHIKMQKTKQVLA